MSNNRGTSYSGIFGASPKSQSRYRPPPMATLEEEKPQAAIGSRTTTPSSDGQQTHNEYDDEENDEDMTLDEILQELKIVMDAANAGKEFDENYLDYLLRKQEQNPEYQEEVAKKLANWKSEYKNYFNECLNITRSFVPPTVFTENLTSLMDMGLSQDVSKRILQKKCLWLVRMDQA